MAPLARWIKMDSPVKPANDSGRYPPHRSLAQAHAGAVGGFGAFASSNKNNAGFLEGVLQRLHSCIVWRCLAGLELEDGERADA